MHEIMNTKEVAEYLRIKERKVYELVSDKEIPCSRVGGKWVFPKALIDRWLISNSQGADIGALTAPPQVVAGSHDPLLEWAIRESGSDLASQFTGSLDGLKRYAAGKAMLAGCHIRTDEAYNTPVVRQMLPSRGLVLLTWAWRDQGLIVARDNPHGIRSLQDVLERGLRVIGRQPGAGSQILLQHLLQQQGVDTDRLNLIDYPARSETDVAAAIVNGHADVGLGIAAVSSQLNLGFIGLVRERYDLVCARRDYFEAPIQSLMAFTRSERFLERAAELGGYDVSRCGEVVYNSA